MAAITGSYLYTRFQQKEGQAYTGYFPIAEWNQMFEEALIQAADQRYRNPQDQKANDEILSLITTNNTLSIVNNNKFYLAPLSLSSVTNVGTTVTATTFLPHNLITGQTVTVTGITGFTTNNPNGGPFTVTVTGPNSFTYVVGAAPTGTYTSNTGITYLIGGQLVDYFHILNIQAYYLETLPSTALGQNYITNASNTSPIRITCSDFNNLRSGEQISISGITGNTNANGTFYITKVNDLQVDLYSDFFRQTPVVGNGVYGGTPIVSRVYNNVCTRLLPDEKISPLIKPSPRSPKYEMADSMIKVYPQTNYICSKITIDYKRRPLNVYGTGLFVDGNDNVLDLSLYYNEKFLNNVNDLVLIMAAGESRDGGLTQFETQQLNDNP